MRVAALFSGGKDSTLAAWVARSQGWDVTHLVTVVPARDDSWMFHVPNLHVAPVLAEAIGLPLVTIESGGEAEREVDDLARGLEGLDVDGLVAGAVASEYQRVRVERVGERLGLKTFTPLWHKPPLEILDTLIAGAFDVRFVAASADGLGPEWLGRRLTKESRDALEALARSKGINPAGEGGEYETIVLDGPLFRSRVEVTRATPEWRRDRGVWRIEETRLVEKVTAA
ncbi:MAG TPA: TIGR00289 family protein [Candidatus Thermoplasmatota archaeon]|nr:TIGR00289 family protein [Candidatus Thermoplasmatota archaeon]